MRGNRLGLPGGRSAAAYVYLLPAEKVGCWGACSVRSDRQNVLQMSGFLVEGGRYVDVVCGAGGVLVGRGVAGRGQGVAAGSGGAGFVAVGSSVAWADRGAFSPGGVGVGSGGVERWSSDDRDGELHSIDGAQDALSVGVSDACGGGLGLDSLAAVLSDLVERAGAGRVDGPQADQAAGLRDGERGNAHVDRKRDALQALSSSCGADRLDGDRGGCEVSDRCRVGRAWGQGAGTGGPQAGAADRREQTAGAGSLAGDRSPAAGDHTHDPGSFGGGEG